MRRRNSIEEGSDRPEEPEHEQQGKHGNNIINWAESQQLE